MKNVTAFGKEVASKPAMSVKEARKRLGKNYRKLSDKQIEHLISLLSGLAQETVHNLGSKITY